MDLNKLTPIINKPNGWALMPLVVFLCLYLVTSLIVNDFYKVPITVAFLVASVYAVATTKGLSLNDRILQYSSGAANKNIMLMLWIFILAGAFAQSAKAMGAIDATVNLTLLLLPDNLLLAGIFLASCFISLSIGTSVGTIVALTPVAAGIAMKTDVSLPFMTALVIGGAFFGDNLSFISDTTIAATRTQGCVMRDKFRVNFLIAVPAALLVFIYYIIYGTQVESASEIHTIEWGKVIPYLIVLGTAIAGMNVTLVLLLGVLSTGIIGCIYGSFDLFGWFASMGEGITGMGELIIITLMAGGMLELIRFNGGVDYILHHLTRHVSNKRGAELSIAALVSLANFCTANNTIAIITVGPLANNIAEQFRVDKRKSASILDTFSCVVQGLIPYGAQMLIAAELTKLSPISIIGYLYYPIILGIVALLSILLRYPKRYS
ncbi:Na+/H+ antiporter NhaC family protein [Phocaeicola coprocola]|jgi:Na+/H+ antiporter NhaC|uniref:Na+/H+ antiporter NhaC family protein n=1 Tax=Phocaeicola coprocola TaxID=310298 RepID=UPI0026DD015F|nr:Na+/H+ antiporter NhaC family protein [Phocaeicola coprocola]